VEELDRIDSWRPYTKLKPEGVDIGK